jgi:hypothetical protein
MGLQHLQIVYLHLILLLLQSYTFAMSMEFILVNYKIFICFILLFMDLLDL